MRDLTWSASEKKVARQAFDLALQAEYAQLMAEFKARADAAENPGALWEIMDWLDSRRREIDTMYDYRYSQLIYVFGNLLSKGVLTREQLHGLSEDKLQFIDFFMQN